MRTRIIRKAPTEVQRKSKLRYDSFPDLHSCWEQSTAHKKYFLDYLDCPTRQRYHHQEHACKAFDDLVERLLEF